MKTINYRGITFEVEDHFKYVATDEDGSVFVYENEPYLTDGEWLDVGRIKMLRQSVYESWENSLESI